MHCGGVSVCKTIGRIVHFLNLYSGYDNSSLLCVMVRGKLDSLYKIVAIVESVVLIQYNSYVY